MGQFKPEQVGQFKPEWVGQFGRNLQIVSKAIIFPQGILLYNVKPTVGGIISKRVRRPQFRFSFLRIFPYGFYT